MAAPRRLIGRRVRNPPGSERPAPSARSRRSSAGGSSRRPRARCRVSTDRVVRSPPTSAVTVSSACCPGESRSASATLNTPDRSVVVVIGPPSHSTEDFCAAHAVVGGVAHRNDQPAVGSPTTVTIGAGGSDEYRRSSDTTESGPSIRLTRRRACPTPEPRAGRPTVWRRAARVRAAPAGAVRAVRWSWTGPGRCRLGEEGRLDRAYSAAGIEPGEVRPHGLGSHATYRSASSGREELSTSTTSTRRLVVVRRCGAWSS